MKLRELAAGAVPQLLAAGVPDASFEAEYLARAVAGVGRAAYFAGREATIETQARFGMVLKRRLAREPAPYITGVREFFGRSFTVGPGVLVPRPETELLVEVALAELERDPRAVVADIGTGSGCVAVSLAAERPGAFVAAVDVSAVALAFARRNACCHRRRLHFLRGDLAAPLARADVVLANLPYIPSAEIDALEPEVSRWEPRVALDGGPDGLALIRRLVADCGARLRPSLLALEVGYAQAAEAARLACAAGARVEVLPDLTGVDRVVCARWR